jgi:CO/xanthine dehydrogenase Mo-binding subunit
MSRAATTAPLAVSRREFLKAGAAGSAALVLGFSMDADAQQPSAQQAAAEFKPNVWIRVEPSGAVEVLISKTEMGQGTATGMAMILADELDADWQRVSVRTVRPDGKRTMITGGSFSIQGAWVVGRRYAAAAREMLRAAGAAAMNVSLSECITEQHTVLHTPSGRRMGYGELTARAAALPVPEKPPLKDPAQFKIIGKDLPAKNLRELCTARATYGIDVKVPGMLYASIERCPVINGRIASVDDATAKTTPGVVQVLKLRGNTFPTYNYVRDGVAVLATSSWAAMQGRKALRVRWNEAWADGRGQNGTQASSKALDADFARVLTQADTKPQPGIRAEAQAVRKGTAEAMTAAFASAAKTLDLTYDVPLQTHVPLEPMNATAHWRDDFCELWVPCHFQTRLLNAVKELTGLPNEKILIHTPMLGGSFGRRLEVDYAIEAVMLSRDAGKPVQVLWTREDDVHCGSFGPPSKHRVRVALDSNGSIRALDHAFATVSVWQQQEPHEIESSGVDFAAAIDAIKFPYAAVNLAVRHRLIEQTIRVFWWRRGYTPNHTFVNECLLDECAHAAGADPLAYRLRMLPANQKLEFDNKDDKEIIDTARLANVLHAAAKAANWGTPLPAGQGRGIAATVTGTHVAMVVEVAVQGSAIKVKRVVTAVDCGTVINPQLVKAQVEGNVVFGLTAALKGAITVENGRVQQSNFHDYPLLAMDEMPAIDTVLINSGGLATGTGEQMSHPVAAALSNAVFAATGQRLRKTPFRLG